MEGLCVLPYSPISFFHVFVVFILEVSHILGYIYYKAFNIFLLFLLLWMELLFQFYGILQAMGLFAFTQIIELGVLILYSAILPNSYKLQ